MTRHQIEILNLTTTQQVTIDVLNAWSWPFIRSVILNACPQVGLRGDDLLAAPPGEAELRVFEVHSYETAEARCRGLKARPLGKILVTVVGTA